jgi:predicted outer membrane repeat protein
VEYTNPFDPNYDYNDHTYTWNIGTLLPGDSNYVTLTVRVNNLASPLGKITNLCLLCANEIHSIIATEITDVNYWNPGVIYVDVNAVGSKIGLSWYHAYSNLQFALKNTKAWDVNQIWIAEGTYKPITASNRSISFELFDKVALYGGFPPGGGTWIQRNPNVYETILSGDIAEPNDQYDNSYHVVKCLDVNNAVLDGFIITAGKADGSGAHEYGGGMYCWDSYGLILRNCSISDNSARKGGALFNYSCDPNINNCIFTENTAEYDGGGIYNYQSSPSIINCTFSGNSATTVGNSYGGAMYNTDSSEPNISNCTFSNNSADEGGAVYNYYYSGPNITNCVFNSNTANDY